MKYPNCKIIPEEILDFVLKAFNRKEEEKTHLIREWSNIQPLTKSIKKFLKQNEDRLPSVLTFKFCEGISQGLIRRAFNQKSPNGASKELRDLLAYYATDGKNNWNELINEYFIDKFFGLLDKQENNVTPQRKKISIEDIYEGIQGIAEKISKPEFGFIEKQIEFEKEIVPNAPAKVGELITIPSLNDPNEPEFPPAPFYKPKFPATETSKINIPGFKNVWLKDEGINPTGTHKDRMAWEITIKALRFNIPEISIISSGSAAIAIKHFFNLYNVPTKLKVLVDGKLNYEIKKAIKQIGCELFETDLSHEELTDEKIRKLTNNKKGIDITYRETMDVHNTEYYDWMSYEILNNNPEHCFIPFGTGDLFVNVLKIVHREYINRPFPHHDPRFFGDINIIKKCNFLGASTKNEKSKLDKLFSYFLPSLTKHKQFIAELKNHCIGPYSGIYFVEEKVVDEAINIANKQKIKCEPSGIAGLALLLQMRDKIPPDKKILIVNTGRTNYSPSIPIPLSR